MERDRDDDLSRDDLLERIATALMQAALLRRSAIADAELGAARQSLRDWQAARLAANYPDLLVSERYGDAARFFLSDLYGPMDFSRRDTEIERILPMLRVALPSSGLETLSLAMELDALSESLDADMVATLPRQRGTLVIDEERYANAYCRVDRRADRERQIALIVDTGEALEALARKSLVAGALRVMRGPAQLAGLGELHEFLERGFAAFRRMGPADEFLARIADNERRLMAQWLAPAKQVSDKARLAPADAATSRSRRGRRNATGPGRWE